MLKYQKLRESQRVAQSLEYTLRINWNMPPGLGIVGAGIKGNIPHAVWERASTYLKATFHDHK